jgi:cyclopropane fatty-acyl-phospholipid synthase-like methyltransferase
MRAAKRLHGASGVWPQTWPAPPHPVTIRGIELMACEVERARRALGADGGVELGDIREVDFGAADAVVILDVLHYVTPQAQADVLRRARAALPAGGLLLLRVSDAGGGFRHRVTQWADRAVTLMRGHGWMNVYCRSLAEWRSLLQEIGFDSEAVPMSQGTLFANVLLIARARSASAGAGPSA